MDFLKENEKVLLISHLSDDNLNAIKKDLSASNANITYKTPENITGT